MILPLLFQAQEVVQELLDAPKLKKEGKKKKATGSAMGQTSKTDHFFKLAPFRSRLTDLIN